MRRIRSVHTSPERTVRKIISGLGYRYRLHGKRLPGKPDLVFAKDRKVVFVHGCFWHQHNRCVDGRVPKSNTAYWSPKLEANKKRDIRHKKALSRAGWKYLVLWECEVEKGADRLVNRIRKFLAC